MLIKLAKELEYMFDSSIKKASSLCIIDGLRFSRFKDVLC